MPVEPPLLSAGALLIPRPPAPLAVLPPSAAGALPAIAGGGGGGGGGAVWLCGELGEALDEHADQQLASMTKLLEMMRTDRWFIAFDSPFARNARTDSDDRLDCLL
jgi:hypothetical protein